MELQVGDWITDERGEWRVVGRPHTTLGGQSAHVRVELVEQPPPQCTHTRAPGLLTPPICGAGLAILAGRPHKEA